MPARRWLSICAETNRQVMAKVGDDGILRCTICNGPVQILVGCDSQGRLVPISDQEFERGSKTGDDVSTTERSP